MSDAIVLGFLDLVSIACVSVAFYLSAKANLKLWEQMSKSTSEADKEVRDMLAMVSKDLGKVVPYLDAVVRKLNEVE